MSFKLAGLDTDARSSETLYRERALTFLKRLAARVWRRIPALIAECVCAASKVLCGSNPSHTGSDAKQLGKEFQASCIDSGTSTRGGIPRSSPLRCERLVLIYKVRSRNHQHHRPQSLGWNRQVRCFAQAKSRSIVRSRPMSLLARMSSGSSTSTWLSSKNSANG
jgi:hypothetical protein